MKLETLKTTVIGQRLVKAYQVLRQEQADEYVLTYPQGILGTAKYHQIQEELTNLLLDADRLEKGEEPRWALKHLVMGPPVPDDVAMFEGFDDWGNIQF